MTRNIFGITYGRSKSGKTMACVRAFPGALFLAPPGALLSAKWLDWEPQVVSVKRTQGFQFLAQTVRKAASKFNTIVIDDLSLIADAELELCKKAASGFAAFDLFNRRMYDLRDACREVDAHVFMTCHEQAPREVKKDNYNRYIPGAPLVPGWQAPEKLPAMADFVARVVHDDEASGWPFVYETGPDQNYVTGDRLAILPSKFPLNLREAMLGAGIDVPRPESLAWMEEHVESISHELQEEFLEAKPSHKAVLLRASKRFDNHSPRHVRWVLADAMDRMVLRRHTRNMLTDFIGNY